MKWFIVFLFCLAIGTQGCFQGKDDGHELNPGYFDARQLDFSDVEQVCNALQVCEEKLESCTFAFGTQICYGDSEQSCYDCCTAGPEMMIESRMYEKNYNCLLRCIPTCGDNGCAGAEVLDQCITDCHEFCGII